MALSHDDSTIKIIICIVIIIILFFDPDTQFPGMKKLRHAIQKSKKNQAGMNLTPPPSKNSHAVRWHCTAESKRRVAEIKSCCRRPTDQQPCDRVSKGKLDPTH